VSHPDYPDEAYYRLDIDIPIPSDFTIEPVKFYSDTNKTVTSAYNMNKRYEDTIIRNNLIKFNRARGIFVDGNKTSIESNIISFTTRPAIWMGSLQRYNGPEGMNTFISQNVWITGNTFNYNQNYGGETPSSIDKCAAIYCATWDKLALNTAPNSDRNYNINITDNQFNDCGYSAIRVNSANWVKTSENTFNNINKLTVGETYAIEHKNCTAISGINVNNTLTNCTVTQEVKVW
jgi:hypothetical protein